MLTETDAQFLTFGNWVFRFRPAQEKPARLLILLHGWTGDENSMGIFARKLSPRFSILAPRAPFTASDAGYSWREMKPGTGGLPTLDDLRPAAESLLAFIDEWAISAGMEARQFDLIGFSQGAAMTYAFTLLYPARVRALAALSGFLPDGAGNLLAARPFTGKPVFISHGRQDDMISVELARKSVALLEGSGVQVTYCESDGGHKVSKECLDEMEAFFARI